MEFVAIIDAGRPNNIVVNKKEIEGKSCAEIIQHLGSDGMKLYINTPFFSESLPMDSHPLDACPNIILKERPDKYNKPPFYLSIHKTDDYFSLFVDPKPINFDKLPVFRTDFNFNHHRNGKEMLEQISSIFDIENLDLQTNSFSDEESNEEIFSKFRTKYIEISMTLTDKAIKKIKHRGKIIEEIISTEESYLGDLTELSTYWYGKFKRSNAFNESELNFIFKDVPGIQNCHTLLYTKLKERGTNYESVIGDVFIDMSSFFKVSLNFISNYGNMISLVNKKTEIRGNARLLEHEHDGNEFTSYLITPVQRMPRYKLFIRELIKSTPRSHPDYDFLPIAESLIDTVTQEMDAATKKAEQLAVIYKIQNKISKSYNLFDVANRTLVMVMDVIVSKSNCHFYLFNDLVMLTNIDKRGETVLLVSKIVDFKYFPAVSLLSFYRHKKGLKAVLFQSVDNFNKFVLALEEKRSTFLKNVLSSFLWSSPTIIKPLPKLNDIHGVCLNDNFYFFGESKLVSLNFKVTTVSITDATFQKYIGCSVTGFGEKIFIFGGHIPGEYTNNLWQYDVLSENWTLVNIQHKPEARCEHTAVKIDHSIVIFGGRKKKKYFNDICIFYPKKKKWKILSVHGAPPPRSMHSAVAKDKKMYIYGGKNGPYVYNDIHIFDYETKTWKTLYVNLSIIPKRFGHRSVLIENLFISIGGTFGPPEAVVPPMVMKIEKDYPVITYESNGNDPFPLLRFGLCFSQKQSLVAYVQHSIFRIQLPSDLEKIVNESKQINKLKKLTESSSNINQIPNLSVTHNSGEMENVVKSRLDLQKKGGSVAELLRVHRNRIQNPNFNSIDIKKIESHPLNMISDQSSEYFQSESELSGNWDSTNEESIPLYELKIPLSKPGPRSEKNKELIKALLAKQMMNEAKNVEEEVQNRKRKENRRSVHFVLDGSDEFELLKKKESENDDEEYRKNDNKEDEIEGKNNKNEIEEKEESPKSSINDDINRGSDQKMMESIKSEDHKVESPPKIPKEEIHTHQIIKEPISESGANFHQQPVKEPISEPVKDLVKEQVQEQTVKELTQESPKQLDYITKSTGNNQITQSNHHALIKEVNAKEQDQPSTSPSNTEKPDSPPPMTKKPSPSSTTAKATTLSKPGPTPIPKRGSQTSTIQNASFQTTIKKSPSHPPTKKLSPSIQQNVSIKLQPKQSTPSTVVSKQQITQQKPATASPPTMTTVTSISQMATQQPAGSVQQKTTSSSAIQQNPSSTSSHQNLQSKLSPSHKQPIPVKSQQATQNPTVSNKNTTATKSITSSASTGSSKVVIAARKGPVMNRQAKPSHRAPAPPPKKDSKLKPAPKSNAPISQKPISNQLKPTPQIQQKPNTSVQQKHSAGSPHNTTTQRPLTTPYLQQQPVPTVNTSSVTQQKLTVTTNQKTTETTNAPHKPLSTVQQNPATTTNATKPTISSKLTVTIQQNPNTTPNIQPKPSSSTPSTNVAQHKPVTSTNVPQKQTSTTSTGTQPKPTTTAPTKPATTLSKPTTAPTKPTTTLSKPTTATISQEKQVLTTASTTTTVNQQKQASTKIPAGTQQKQSTASPKSTPAATSSAANHNQPKAAPTAPVQHNKQAATVQQNKQAAIVQKKPTTQQKLRPIKTAIQQKPSTTHQQAAVQKKHNAVSKQKPAPAAPKPRITNVAQQQKYTTVQQKSSIIATHKNPTAKSQQKQSITQQKSTSPVQQKLTPKTIQQKPVSVHKQKLIPSTAHSPPTTAPQKKTAPQSQHQKQQTIPVAVQNKPTTNLQNPQPSNSKLQQKTLHVQQQQQQSVVNPQQQSHIQNTQQKSTTTTIQQKPAATQQTSITTVQEKPDSAISQQQHQAPVQKPIPPSQNKPTTEVSTTNTESQQKLAQPITITSQKELSTTADQQKLTISAPSQPSTTSNAAAQHKPIQAPVPPKLTLVHQQKHETSTPVESQEKIISTVVQQKPETTASQQKLTPDIKEKPETATEVSPKKPSITVNVQRRSSVVSISSSPSKPTITIKSKETGISTNSKNSNEAENLVNETDQESEIENEESIDQKENKISTNQKTTITSKQPLKPPNAQSKLQPAKTTTQNKPKQQQQASTKAPINTKSQINTKVNANLKQKSTNQSRTTSKPKENTKTMSKPSTKSPSTTIATKSHVTSTTQRTLNQKKTTNLSSRKVSPMVTIKTNAVKPNAVKANQPKYTTMSLNAKQPTSKVSVKGKAKPPPKVKIAPKITISSKKAPIRR
ncbi:hypothetical protein TRFO_35066 [Tritrichomonas foetus]|uniref:DH domain-containing protein n=1 Tax=Tritrichomonas foetus TaxID=1144522 RepID=A0A1J4JII4_9EUKA|nr:hypothetical protein TRFO_35066 [Tritrichomonas foetus]|eukprot:OHS98497.1 hypothetical protein TRFO_35066 [Tritrichomonas foetus]